MTRPGVTHWSNGDGVQLPMLAFGKAVDGAVVGVSRRRRSAEVRALWSTIRSIGTATTARASVSLAIVGPSAAHPEPLQCALAGEHDQLRIRSQKIRTVLVQPPQHTRAEPGVAVTQVGVAVELVRGHLACTTKALEYEPAAVL
jgi:hypothetical protein